MCKRSTLLAAMVPIVSAGLVACGSDGPGTSVRLTLDYADALELDIAEVTLAADRTESGPIAHELLLLVPDRLAGMSTLIEVWGRKGTQQVAYGQAMAEPELGKTIETQVSLTACTPGCQGDMLLACGGEMVSCPLGCSDDGAPHCIAPTPSNGIPSTEADALTGTITISTNATFDTDTGEIITGGGLLRPVGDGILEGIKYRQADPTTADATRLGIFAFHNLVITANVRFKGARAAVLFVGNNATIEGDIDLSGGFGMQSASGPGGGAGGTGTNTAGGCGPGGRGGKAGINDGGGGGGGAGEAGGRGGGPTSAVGAGGPSCLPALLEPLQGGSGGGSSSAGLSTSAVSGGGGGGALQITALGTLRISGTLNAGGAGGEGGVASSGDGGAGAGGGSGGALLLEAPILTIAGGVLVANGGGGGGGGGDTLPGNPGSKAGTTSSPAPGGAGANQPSGGGTGGVGGAADSPPGDGANQGGNAGGGGGGGGKIVLRGRMRSVSGTLSPPAMQLDIKPPS